MKSSKEWKVVRMEWNVVEWNGNESFMKGRQNKTKNKNEL